MSGDPRSAEQVPARWLDVDEQHAWRAFLAVQAQLPGFLGSRLERDAGMSLATYVILAMLSEAPDRSLRMSELAARANVSPSRLSHSVSRMEADGWVRRRPAGDDGRGQVATLTDEGWQRVRAAAPRHVGDVREVIFDALDARQVSQLTAIMQTVLDRLAAAGTRP